jgi:hypothetical protein
MTCRHKSGHPGELGGQTVNIQSGADTRIVGSNVLGDQGLDINAGGKLSIEAAHNTQGDSSFNETKKSGLFSSGGLSFTIGKQPQSLDVQNTQTTAVASTVGAIDGNVNLSAGRNCLSSAPTIIRDATVFSPHRVLGQRCGVFCPPSNQRIDEREPSCSRQQLESRCSARLCSLPVAVAAAAVTAVVVVVPAWTLAPNTWAHGRQLVGLP